MSTFVPARELCADFYREVIAPIASPYRHAAALLGWGSDVLGYDTERSTDHGWGPRLQLFVSADDVAALRTAVDAGLPESFRGWPVTIGWDDTDPAGRMAPRHFVEVTTLGDWLTGHLGCDPRNDLAAVDWLVLPQQLLLGVVRGAVYADPGGELAAVRSSVAWYPDQVWRWLLACQWRRVAQEEHLIGRAAEVGDELGSRIAGARQVRELMRLGFLVERTYWPYTKWFGTAFAELDLAADLTPHLNAALVAADYPARETGLCAASELLAERFNALGLTEWVDPAVRPFFGRPFRVLAADRFTLALRTTITDPQLTALPLIGAVDQFADSTDVLGSAATARRLGASYASALAAPSDNSCG